MFFNRILRVVLSAIAEPVTAAERIRHSESERPASTQPQAAIEAEFLRQRVTAVLAEYAALRAEILNRSTAQNLLLGVHLTALIASLGSLTSAVARWTIFLIPFEASVIGLWYMDHAVVIEQLGYHLQTSTEDTIRRLLGDPRLIWWESRYAAGITEPPGLHVTAFKRLLPLTFLAPGVVSLLMVVMLSLIKRLSSESAGLVTWVYNDWERLPAALAFSIDIVLVFALGRTFRRRSRMNEERSDRAGKQLRQS